MSTKRKPSIERTVKAEILVCPVHGYYAIAFDDRRITSSKCCGSWKTVRRWDVAESTLLAVLAQEKSA